jgi:branched-chain amino acid transport system permease protein
MLRIVNSPFGRVLMAIRENAFRAEAIGYRTVVYRTASNVLAALFATVAGALLALWLRYAGPETSMSFEIMLDVLLIVVIGGMGTVYGAVIGSVLFVLAQNYLQDLMRLAEGPLGDVPVLGALVSPDRWLLWLGVLFVLSVYHFPTGIVGRLRTAAAKPPVSLRSPPPEGAAAGVGGPGARRPSCAFGRLSPCKAATSAAPAASCTSPTGARLTVRSWSLGTAWRARGATWTRWRSI